MPKIKLFIEKTLEQNASIYFDKAKKAKKKMAGTIATLEKNIKKLAQIKKKEASKEVKKERVQRKKAWYEKFRWFISSEDFLVVGGRDATTNDIVVKKHMDKDDLVFHTDMAGSPFFIIKSEGKAIGPATIGETAQATASYNSRAWKAGLASVDVFYVKPEQVTKEAQAGEFLKKGAFMIRGKTTYLHPEMQLAIGIKNDQIIGGPTNAIKHNAEQFVIIIQGRDKASAIAKKIRSKFKADVDLDDIIRFLPPGGCKIKK